MTYEASILVPSGKIRVNRKDVRFIPDGKLDTGWRMTLLEAEKIFDALAAQIKLAREL